MNRFLSALLASAAAVSMALAQTPQARRSDAAGGRALELPANQTMIIRLVDDVDSERDSIGKTYRASLDRDVLVGSEIALAKGTDVTAKLAEEKDSGKLRGRAELTLQVVSFTYKGREVPIESYDVVRQSDSQGASTTKKAATGAAVGAVLGAILGGGKGAAIGAGAGAGAGAATQIFTKGQRVRIPSETILTFTLTNAVRLQ